MKVVNRSQLAELLSVNLSTVDNWVRDGCPFLSRPVRQGVGQWEFSPAAVFQWRIDRERQAMLGALVDVDEAEARRRKLAAEAGLAELQLRKANGEVVAIADAQKAWSQMVGAARAKLLSIPTKLAPLLAVETSELVCQAAIEAAVHEALTELSTGEADQDVPDEVSPRPNDAAETGQEAKIGKKKRVARK
jgi:phage terminase Nu1 subunit (DNA packaging protein)